MNDPKAIVKRGYDMVSNAYRSDDFQLEGTGYEKCLNILTPYLKHACRILDWGCGCGVPVAKYLANNYKVTGLDISEKQIKRARNLVPNADFICADMTKYNFEKNSFDSIISFYTIIHIPLEEQFSLLQKATEWLIESGFLMITVGSEAWTGSEDDWRGIKGATMYWSHADRNTYEKWLVDLGYNIIEDVFIPEGNGGHNTFIAQRTCQQGHAADS